ncbi:MAG: hypothetical protein OEU32_14220 [Acidimicrobiia bacterium]|nr:hypothetical protein [Acidimicrobiia bacterium]
MPRADGRPACVLIGADPSALISDYSLRDHVDIVATAATVDEVARQQPAAQSFEVAVVDMTDPDDEAQHIIRNLTTSYPSVGVVAALGTPLDETSISLAVDAGAHACATPRTIAEFGGAPFAAAAAQQLFLPTAEVHEMLAAAAGEKELTSSQRDARLRNLVIGLIPLAGVFAGLIALLWRQYLGQIGVRPVDLAVDPATRIADAFFTVSVLVGVIGPQAFVGSWLDLISDSAGDGRLASWIRRHRLSSHLALAVLTFVLAVAIAQLTQFLFALFVGPLVAGLLLAKFFDLDDDLPRVLQIRRLVPARAIGAVTVLVVFFLGLLSYEVVVRGPSFDESGETGFIAPSVLGFNAQPVQVTAVEDGTTSEMLYLGGNADLYVLVDPCDADRTDYVSVGATKLTVIDQVRCD